MSELSKEELDKLQGYFDMVKLAASAFRLEQAKEFYSLASRLVGDEQHRDVAISVGANMAKTIAELVLKATQAREAEKSGPSPKED